jgi:hypothetical protein
MVTHLLDPKEICGASYGFDALSLGLGQFGGVAIRVQVSG